MKIDLSKLDLRKKFGVYKIERENRQNINLLLSLLNIDPKLVSVSIINEQLSQILTKSDAAKLAKFLQQYSES